MKKKYDENKTKKSKENEKIRKTQENEIVPGKRLKNIF